MMARASASGRQSSYSSAYAIFEGGGARGIAHLGALKAMDDEKKAIVGVAGTSAGAIIAALVAVGYTTEEIFASGTDNIFSKLNLGNPITVLGQRQWYRLRRFRTWARFYAILLAIAAGLMIAAAIGATLMFFSKAYEDWPGVLALIAWVLTALGMFYFWSWFRKLTDRAGIFDSDVIRDVVNSALHAKLKQHYKALGLARKVPEKIQFKDIDPAEIDRCIPLKIVVTNVSTGEMLLFDRRDSSVVVADAVAASAALPFAFMPALIRSYSRADHSLFSDGGLVSNLPSWVFRDEKRVRERLETNWGGTARIPIYAFSLNTREDEDEDSPPPAKPNPRPNGRLGVRASLGHFRKVAMAGIFGSQTIIQGFVSDLRVVPVKTSLKTMDFDCTAAQARQAIEDGRASAGRFLRRERLTNQLTQISLDNILAEMSEEIRTRRNAEPPRLRVALIDPLLSPNEHAAVGFQVIQGANMDQHADDRLELDLEKSIAAQAYGKNEAVLGTISGGDPAGLYMTKYEYAMMPADLASVIAVPIYAQGANEPRPQRILALDSNDDLSAEFGDTAFMKRLNALAMTASRKLINDTVAELLDAQSAQAPADPTPRSDGDASHE